MFHAHLQEEVRQGLGPTSLASKPIRSTNNVPGEEEFHVQILRKAILGVREMEEDPGMRSRGEGSGRARGDRRQFHHPRSARISVEGVETGRRGRFRVAA
jgi:hypothetical protein